MGFSVSLASTIIIIGMVASTGAFAGTIFYTTHALHTSLNALTESEEMRLDTRLELGVRNVSARTLRVSVGNIGSRTVFLSSGQTYRWNTIIVSYGGSSYPIEDYEIIEVSVQGSNTTFTPADHEYIAPGEECLLEVDLPGGAPDIPSGVVVTVVFASHYGAAAVGEGVGAT